LRQTRQRLFLRAGVYGVYVEQGKTASTKYGAKINGFVWHQKDVNGMKLRYAYYPGCASKEMTREADKTTRAVASAFGIELMDMPRANCCGAGLVGDFDPLLSLSLNARIFSEAERMGVDILTICSTCLMIMRSANLKLKTDASLLNEVNEVLKEAGLTYRATVEVTHLLNVLHKEVGAAEVAKHVKRPLNGLKVAPFYGCHTLRPSSALGHDDPEKPESLEDLIKAVGAEPVEYSGKTKCCGFQSDLVSPDTAIRMTATRLIDAKDSGAVCVVTPCPFCHINLDNYQSQAEKKAGRKINLPVFHLAQLIGASLGLGAKDMGLERHLVNLEELLY